MKIIDKTTGETVATITTNSSLRQGCVLTRELVSSDEDYDEELGYPVRINQYSKWHYAEIPYDELCHDLGFNPDVEFIDVTRSGRITYTVGKPQEITALRNAVQRSRRYALESDHIRSVDIDEVTPDA